MTHRPWLKGKVFPCWMRLDGLSAVSGFLAMKRAPTAIPLAQFFMPEAGHGGDPDDDRLRRKEHGLGVIVGGKAKHLGQQFLVLKNEPLRHSAQSWSADKSF